MKTRGWFPSFARGLSAWTGRASTFGLAIALVALWAFTGPVFGYSDTWQLVINTATTVVTFLMVFLIQNTQNRDTQAMHIKLDEIIRATEGSHNAILDLEEMDEEDLQEQHRRYVALATRAREALEKGGQDVDCPALDDLPKAQPEDLPRAR